MAPKLMGKSIKDDTELNNKKFLKLIKKLKNIKNL